MIYITGDTHIPIDIAKLNSSRFTAQKKMTKNDYLIICGDFGGVWDNGKTDIYWQKWLDSKNFTTLFVDGNHENFNLLNEFEVVDFCEGKAHKISNSIFHLMRGQIYTIDKKRIFTFGGASSHDKEYRKKDVSWWESELPDEKEIKKAVENLKNANWEVDYIVTHCAPDSIQALISNSYDQNILTEFLEYVKNNASFERWFFGHYHKDLTIAERFCCLFGNITEL